MSMKIGDYVEADIVKRMGYTGDGLVLEWGAQKTPPKVALKNGWGLASSGAALGAIHPNIFRAMFERTHAPVPKEKWRSAYLAGLDIGPEQPQTSYAETEASENKTFMEYCQQFRPEFYAVLKD
jgi:hypothetical protein